ELFRVIGPGPAAQNQSAGPDHQPELVHLPTQPAQEVSFQLGSPIGHSKVNRWFGGFLFHSRVSKVARSFPNLACYFAATTILPAAVVTGCWRDVPIGCWAPFSRGDVDTAFLSDVFGVSSPARGECQPRARRTSIPR